MPAECFPRIRVSERGTVVAGVEHDGPFTGTSEPLIGLFRALQERLAAEGALEAELLGLDLRVPDPAAFDGLQVERLWREHFAGNVPVLRVHASDRPGLTVYGELPPRDEPRGAVYNGYSASELQWQYGPILWEDGVQDTLAGWRRRGEEFLRSREHRADLRYGPGPRETLDLFPPERAGAPLAVFFHGGYWQMMDKSDHCQFTAGLLDGGAAVAVVNYDLCPSVPLSAIAGQVRGAVRWLHENAARLGYRDHGMQVIGHSAGGHLAALAAADGGPVGSAVLVSGLYDLTPLMLMPIARTLGLNRAADGLSPAHLDPDPGLRAVVAVGERESDEWHRQSAVLAGRWRARAASVTEVEVPDAAHFGAVESLLTGELRDLALDLL